MSTEYRIRELRFGLEMVIEKARYDEYGSFEDIRRRIIALAQEFLEKDSKLAEIETKKENENVVN